MTSNKNNYLFLPHIIMNNLSLMIKHGINQEYIFGPDA